MAPSPAAAAAAARAAAAAPAPTARRPRRTARRRPTASAPAATAQDARGAGAAEAPPPPDQPPELGRGAGGGAAAARAVQAVARRGRRRAAVRLEPVVGLGGQTERDDVGEPGVLEPRRGLSELVRRSSPAPRPGSCAARCGCGPLRVFARLKTPLTTARRRRSDPRTRQERGRPPVRTPSQAYRKRNAGTQRNTGECASTATMRFRNAHAQAAPMP